MTLWNKALRKLSFRCLPKARHASYHNIEIIDKGSIRIVSINRPEKRNCVNKQTAHELFAAFQEFNVDESVRVGVLCGKGGTFCSGYDLKELAESANPVDSFLKEDFGIGPAPMVGSKFILAYITALCTGTYEDVAAKTGHSRGVRLCRGWRAGAGINVRLKSGRGGCCIRSP